MEIFEFWGAKVDLNMSSQLLTVEEEMEVYESAGEKPQASEYASVLFPPIETSSEKDHVAALGTAQELGVLFPAEVRREILESMNISPIKPWWELPTIEDNPAKKEEQDRADQQAQQAFDQQEKLANQSVVAKQGVSGGVSAKGGAQSTNNQARDNRAADSKKK